MSHVEILFRIIIVQGKNSTSPVAQLASASDCYSAIRRLVVQAHPEESFFCFAEQLSFVFVQAEESAWDFCFEMSMQYNYVTVFPWSVRRRSASRRSASDSVQNCSATFDSNFGKAE
jgi:hypothetical protein